MTRGNRKREFGNRGVEFGAVVGRQVISTAHGAHRGAQDEPLVYSERLPGCKTGIAHHPPTPRTSCT